MEVLSKAYHGGGWVGEVCPSLEEHFIQWILFRIASMGDNNKQTDF